MVAWPLSEPSASAGAVIRKEALQGCSEAMVIPDEPPGVMSWIVQLFGRPVGSTDIVQIPVNLPVDEIERATSSCPPGSTITGSGGKLMETAYGSTMINSTICSSLSCLACVMLW